MERKVLRIYAPDEKLYKSLFVLPGTTMYDVCHEFLDKAHMEKDAEGKSFTLQEFQNNSLVRNLTHEMSPFKILKEWEEKGWQGHQDNSRKLLFAFVGDSPDYIKFNVKPSLSNAGPSRPPRPANLPPSSPPSSPGPTQLPPPIIDLPPPIAELPPPIAMSNTTLKPQATMKPVAAKPQATMKPVAAKPQAMMKPVAAKPQASIKPAAVKPQANIKPANLKTGPGPALTSSSGELPPPIIDPVPPPRPNPIQRPQPQMPQVQPASLRGQTQPPQPQQQASPVAPSAQQPKTPTTPTTRPPAVTMSRWDPTLEELDLVIRDVLLEAKDDEEEEVVIEEPEKPVEYVHMNEKFDVRSLGAGANIFGEKNSAPQLLDFLDDDLDFLK